jgi:beta-fructofuranosidase
MEIPDLLQIDISESSLNEDVYGRPAEIGPLELDADEKLHLRIFIDRSIIEVFANEKQCLTVRVNPEREDSRGISFYSRGSSSELVQLDLWQMKSIWPELKQFEGK